MNDYIRLACIGIILMVTGCNRGPKVIAPAEPNSSEEGTGIFSADASTPEPEESQHLDEGGVHSVVVMEILPTARYVYLRVKEDSDEFWIATIKREIEVGKTYFYRDGLLRQTLKVKSTTVCLTGCIWCLLLLSMIMVIVHRCRNLSLHSLRSMGK